MVSNPAVILVTPMVTSPPDAVIVGNIATNDQPTGGASTNWLAPEGKSFVKPSVIVIVPTLVGEVATVLHILPPLGAGTTVTAEKPVKPVKQSNITNMPALMDFKQTVPDVLG